MRTANCVLASKPLWRNSGPAGYDKKVKGKTAEERLDLRCAMKTDKFCK